MRLREAPDAYATLVDQSHRVRVRVDSWLGPDLLAEDVPIIEGELAETGDQKVPEVLNLTVPAEDPATSTTWAPIEDPGAPLAAFGQRLRVRYVVDRGDGSRVVVPVGWYSVRDWTSNGRVVEVEAAGLLSVVDDDRLLAPTSPAGGATLASELRRLMEGILPIDISTSLVDRAVPSGMAWQDNRLDALYELADAWPADLYVDELGAVKLEPPLDDDDDPELTLYEVDGVIVDRSDSGTRDSGYNVVVARGEAATDVDRPPVVGIALDTDPSSPTYASGPYGRVVRFFASPLLLTEAQCQSAAEKLLRDALRRTRTFPVLMVPDARVRPGVRVDYVRASGLVIRSRVASHSLPLMASGGAQRVVLAEVGA